MTLDDLIRADATALAASGNDLAEAVTFYPDGAKGSGITVQAVVLREEPTVDDERGRQLDASVLIPRAALTDAQKPTKCSKLRLSLQSGEAAVDVRVSEVLTRDNGVWILEVRA